MLIDADETLLHQLALPFSQAGPTDHRFYDRYVFGAWDEAQDIGLLTGLGVYKNMGTTDGFLAVQHGGRQHNLRVADDWDCVQAPGSIGPLEIRVVEPYRRALITVAPNASGLECELHWSTEGGVHFEPAHRAHGAGGSWDYCRYNQSGTISGWLKLGDRRFDATQWWGFRDHSWGVRPGVGGFEPVRKAPGGAAARGLLLSLFYHTDEYSCHMLRIENPAGEVIYQHGTRINRGQRFEPVAELRDWEHEFELVDGRNYRRFRYRAHWSDGRTVNIEGRPLLNAWIFRGTGYDHGFNDGRGLGAQRGRVIEHDISTPGVAEGAGPPQMHFEQPAALLVDGVAVGGYAPMIVYPRPAWR